MYRENKIASRGPVGFANDGHDVGYRRGSPIDGLYTGAGAGVNFMQREQFNISGIFAGSPGSKATFGDVRVSVGFAGVMSLGWGFGNGLRAEAGFNYWQNNGFNNPQAYGFPGASPGFPRHRERPGAKVRRSRECAI
jgi:hypothetical protein